MLFHLTLSAWMHRTVSCARSIERFCPHNTQVHVCATGLSILRPKLNAKCEGLRLHALVLCECTARGTHVFLNLQRYHDSSPSFSRDERLGNAGSSRGGVRVGLVRGLGTATTTVHKHRVLKPLREACVKINESVPDIEAQPPFSVSRAISCSACWALYLLSSERDLLLRME